MVNLNASLVSAPASKRLRANAVTLASGCHWLSVSDKAALHACADQLLELPLQRVLLWAAGATMCCGWDEVNGSELEKGSKHPSRTAKVGNQAAAT